MKQVTFATILAFMAIGAGSADIQRILPDIQRTTREPSRVTMVIWTPSDFWNVILQKSPKVTKEARVRLTTLMDDYLVFMVVVVDIAPSGQQTPKDRAALEANTKLSIDGTVILPLDKEKMVGDGLAFIAVMKPMMASMLGQFGEGTEFFVYPNPPKGADKISATKPGKLSYEVFGNRYDWKLPIGSLLPPRIDAKTGQSFPGDYNYNPYTGEKLTEMRAQP